MSRVICPKCGNTDISWIRDDANYAHYICLECKQEFCYPPKTLFDHITASIEVLSLEFVNEAYDMSKDEFRYYSCLTKEFYDNEKEAIAATMAKLNEVCDG